MALFKCKMCGGDLQLTEGNPLATCEYCGTLQTVPSADSEKKLTLFTRANRLRLGCEFDKAAGVYEALVADFPEEAEAYWGLVLCKYGIEYVDDPATGKKVPTCHRSSFESVMEDKDFEQVLENSDITARKVYREEAKQIEEIRKGIIAVSANEEPYDIFICYKETDVKGDRTLDSVLAQDVYDVLTDKGYRVFFSRITLEDKLGQEYEPYIFAALNSAKVMLAIGTDYEYFNAVWVKNEWSRFLKLMTQDKEKHLIPCYKGIDAYDMPKEFAKLQAQDMGKVGAIQDLLRGIDKLITHETIAAPAASGAGANLAELLAMGNEALEAGNWSVASNRFDLALMADPTCAEAYVGRLLAECKIKHREDLKKSKKRLEKNNNFQEAMAFGNDTLKQELEECRRTIAKRRTRNRIISVVTVMIAVAAAFCALEWSYLSMIRSYYSGAISAESALSAISKVWYREIDDGTKYLLRLELGGEVYPEVRNLNNLVIPNGVTAIKGQAFRDCTNLTSVTIPDSVTSIGNYAFYRCGLASVTIPDSVTSIGNNAFYGCTNLTSVTIGDSVTSIGNSAFCGCTNLTSVTIPDSVTSIGNYAFYRCGLASVTIPDSVTSIGNNAFYECSKLASVTIPDSVTSIGDCAFRGCTSLTGIAIPDSVTSIGDRTFQGCSSLTSITIPDSVTSIGNSAFSGCDQLEDIFYAGTQQQWMQIEIGVGNAKLNQAQIHYDYQG